jgi:ABC-2 type transport system ATP-binding protein
MPGKTPVVSARGLVKRYGDLIAVNDISFDIYPGQIFGLIGPDGAGKTSIFHILGGVMDKTSGEISVLGEVPRLARPDMGYLTQQFSLYLDLSVGENIRYMGGLRQVDEKDFVERRDRYLKLMDLYRFRDRLAAQLSGGMKQKLALCCALIARPKLLLLDEPTTGVDPISRREFWDVLASISDEGVTVAVATPYLDEAERCHTVALIHKGVIQNMGTPQELKKKLGLTRLELRSTKLSAVEKAALALKQGGKSHIVDIQPYGDRLDLLVDDAKKAEDELKTVSSELADSHLSIDQEEPTLENAFVLQLQTVEERLPDLPFPYAPGSIASKGLAIGAQNISKSFGDFQAVKNVSLQVDFGQIFGLLGANGAGKTTTIKILCGLLEASTGEMMLAGVKSDLRNPAVRQQIGYMSQKFTLYDDLSVLSNLEFYCGVYNVPESLRRERIDWVIKTSGLAGQENLITGQLPGGWKQRVSFAASIIHQPKILFLDEPTSGVDPLARRQLWKLIRDVASHGTAVLVTTHFLEEAEFCQKLAFMAAGEIVAQGSPTEIKESQPGSLIEMRTSNNQKAKALLQAQFDPWRVSIFADSVHLVLDKPDTELAKVESIFNQNDIKKLSQRILPFSLEDAFIGIIQRASKQSQVPAA